MLASCQLRNATHPLFCAVFKTKSFVSLVVLKMSKDIFRIPDALKPFFQAVLAEPTLQMNAGIYGESTFRTCKNDRETLYRGKPQ